MYAAHHEAFYYSISADCCANFIYNMTFIAQTRTHTTHKYLRKQQHILVQQILRQTGTTPHLLQQQQQQITRVVSSIEEFSRKK